MRKRLWILSEILYYGGLLSVLGGPAVLFLSHASGSFAGFFLALALVSLFAGGFIKKAHAGREQRSQRVA